MVLFALGFIAGIVTALVLAVVMLYFRKPIISMTTRVEREVDMASKRAFGGSGFVFEPPSEEDLERERIVRENSKRGRDTKISELQ